MEELIEKHIYHQNTTPSSLLTMHKNSQIISKTKPKIRIIHIFAPEIIKTDTENFRELVQRLTGKPTSEEINFTKKNKPRNFNTPSNKKMKIVTSVVGGFKEMIAKEEENIWEGANTGGGFLSGFGSEVEYGFMQEINDQFPFLEGTTTQMDAFGELISSI